MSDMDKLAERWYGSNRLEDTTILASPDTQTYVAVATADSEEGHVAVVLSDSATNPVGIWNGIDWLAPDDMGTAVELPTTESVHEGDRVLVTAFGGSVIATPVVTGVIGSGDSIRQDVDVAQEVAMNAQEVASATNQYFWQRSDNPDGAGAGAFVTEVPQDEFTDSTSPNFLSGPNVLLNSLGMVFRSGMTALASFTTSAVEFFTTAGTSVASFGSSLVRIGQTSGTHVEVDSTGFRVISGGETPLDASVVGGSGVINGDNMELTDSLTVNNTGQFIGGILAGTTADSEYIQHIRWGTGNAVTNSNGITTFNPGMGIKPRTVVIAMQHDAETEAIAKIAVPMIWSIDSANQVQVRWKRTDTGAWLTGNRVCWTWLAIA